LIAHSKTAPREETKLKQKERTSKEFSSPPEYLTDITLHKLGYILECEVYDLVEYN
jgi:hypothetical protein